MTQPRPLTYDEKKASEAAFHGLPFDPEWSQSAKAVYDGILATMNKSATTSELPDSPVTNVEPSRELVPVHTEDGKEVAAESSQTELDPMDESAIQQIHSRREAIDAGYLMDVSEEAKSIGLELAVGMTKPLWDRGICPSGELTEEELHNRIRDVLMAVRLRLAALESPTAFVEIPVLLSFPPDPIPELFLVYALFHKDPLEADSLLLLHPEEVSLAKQSFTDN